MNPWPALLWLVLIGVSLGITIARHGQPRGPFNAWCALISAAVEVALLAWGGFFRPLFGG